MRNVKEFSAHKDTTYKGLDMLIECAKKRAPLTGGGLQACEAEVAAARVTARQKVVASCHRTLSNDHRILSYDDETLLYDHRAFLVALEQCPLAARQVLWL